MSPADKPPKGPKPFLGDNEMSSELDAWDATFDALHGGPEAGQGNEEVMAWPEPAPQIAEPTPTPPPRVPEPALTHADRSRTLDERPAFESELDDQLNLDRAGPASQRPSARPVSEAWELGSSETDFSDVGGDGKPSALGEMLGSSPSLPKFEPAPPPRTTARGATPVPAGDDEDVYTSASRPNVPSPEGGTPLPEDPIVPPPTPAPPPKRTGPAIIRRTPISMSVPKLPAGVRMPEDQTSPFDESTRIASFEELSARSRQDPEADARSKATTAPPPFGGEDDGVSAQTDEEDYADIEIGGESDQAADSAPEPVAPRRTVAHVVRRPEKPRPTQPRPISEPVIEVTHGEPEPDPASEDDFSDVAAAVGASEDGPISEPIMPAYRQESPRVESRSPDARDVAPETPVETGFDDHLPTMARIGEDFEPQSQEDAYVTMGDIDPSIEPIVEHSIETVIDRPPVTALRDGPQPSGPGEVAAQDRPPALVDLFPRVKTPTSVPPLGQLRKLTQETVPDAAEPERRPSVHDVESAELEPTIDLEAINLPEQVQPLPSSNLDEEAAQALLVYERELALIDDTSSSVALRIEAGRLSERLGDPDRARTHYDAALLADPRATAALRGLRRIARAAGDLAEATRQLEAEIAVAGALERRLLGHYRADLLLANGEHDLARVAVGEILDHAPSDVRALLAQLELAFLDGRADEFGTALEKLAHAVTDAELRAAVQSARGLVAAQHNDGSGAATWFAAAAESDATSLGARLGAIRQSAAASNGEATARALVDLAKQVEASDALTAAALGVRAQHWGTGEIAATAAKLSGDAMPADPLVARVAAETMLASNDVVAASIALATWASCAAPPAERAYAAARAAELDPARGPELWSIALHHDPGDDYGAAQLRTAYVATEATQLSIEVDLAAVTGDGTLQRARLRAAFGLIGQDQLEAAIDLLKRGRTECPNSIPLAEALAEALAAAGRWSERAALLGELAAKPGDQLDGDVAQLRSALAWEEAVGAAASANPVDNDEVQRTTAAALEAWHRVIEQTEGGAPGAHAAAIVLASRLGDRDVIGEVLSRAQTAERSPWAAASLALRRARHLTDDPNRAETILREVQPTLDDPRRTTWLMLAAARSGELADAATTLEERAAMLGDTTEASALRLRAAQIALDTGDAARATAWLGQVGRALPALGVVSDLLAAARRRSGDRSAAAQDRGAAHGPAADAFARIVRDGDLAVSHGDTTAALALYQQALELRPADPLAALPLVRVATQLREPEPIAALALGQLRAAEAAGDAAGKAEAYELLAHIDRELRADAGSAQLALESATQADPSRIDLMHRLERDYAVADQLGELLKLRRRELDQIAADEAAGQAGYPRDRAALVMDAASLAERDQRPDGELSELYRAALAADPRHRLALLHLESIVRRDGSSPALAALEEQVATYFEGEPRTQAAFYTRAGETLAEIGQIDAAVQRFGKAEQASPGHVAALEGWRTAALKGQLWIDVAAAATRQAAIESDGDERAKLHHFAGVVLMDKALAAEQAMGSFRRALEADPGHKDSFIRLRILLADDANHDELAILLDNRLEHETEERAKIELHRAIAELHRNFLSDRDSAKQHYREILAADPNDLRAHAAIGDIAWEQGNWQEAAEALTARARLERDSAILTTLCYRLGLIYADRLGDLPNALKAFQRALTYQPDDENTLVRLADLATAAGEWKLALGACERLVKAEQDPDKRVAHLHRVAKIFRLGFSDRKRAERALNLALDGAPANDEALTQLVQFYRDAGDLTSVRVHLNRVAGTMRVRAQTDPKDGVAYRVIARTMAARAAGGADGSLAVARAAAELAQLLGSADEPERVLLAEPPRVDIAPLLRPQSDELLFPRTIPTELRQVFSLLGDRLAKHIGVDLRAYGVGRGDRLRARDSSVAAHAQDVATALGFGEIDVYVSARQPHVMVAEPTSPVSLVLGQGIAHGAGATGRGIRFAAGAALKLAQASLAIPARLADDELGVLVVALVRQFQTDFPQDGLDETVIATHMQKLRRLIPTNLANDLRPFALAIDGSRLRHTQLARDLRIAGLRAGLVASGSLMAGLTILAAQANTDVPSFLADPVAQGLVSFALGEDHAAISR